MTANFAKKHKDNGDGDDSFKNEEIIHIEFHLFLKKKEKIIEKRE
jgi:hypothetical protein